MAALPCIGCASRQGLLTAAGTLIGRVFVDRNGDGEMQRDEPGIANAIVVLDDGTQIVTDEKGLFSVANVASGPRIAALDLTSVPGYRIAPGRLRAHRGPSRLVRLMPGGLARINFGLAPLASVPKRQSSRAASHAANAPVPPAMSGRALP